MNATPPRPSSAADRLAAERLDYAAAHLDDDAPADPFLLFDRWLQDAFDRRERHGDLAEPTAVVLSTVDLAPSSDAGMVPGLSGGDPAVVRPRSRTVLLKSHDPRGFVVYTNKDSAKGTQISRAPWGSMLLPWYPMQRQVRIDGRLEDVPDPEADAYFASRPRPSRIGAWASHQSEPVTSRAALDAAYTEAEARFDGRDVPRPPYWGGYRLVPDRIEFWQGRTGRMHDRLQFEADGSGAWVRHRLQP